MGMTTDEACVVVSMIDLLVLLEQYVRNPMERVDSSNWENSESNQLEVLNCQEWKYKMSLN
jgi:hypothetical protein